MIGPAVAFSPFTRRWSMTKLILGALTVALLAGASRADDVSAKPPAEKSGTVMLAVIRQASEVAVRLRGRAIGNCVRCGMTSQQIIEALGNPDDGWGIPGGGVLVYGSLRMNVTLACETNAANDRATFVTDVSFSPIFPMPQRRYVDAPPPPRPVGPTKDGF
jgi:hypothetical protein